MDLSRLTEEVVAQLRASDPHRVVTVRISPGLHAKADRMLLRVVLENLLGNAWKFTSKRTDAVIEVGVLNEVGKSEVYSVRDNGAGFDMKHAGKLFGVFERLHDSHEFSGTGVGLATVQRIIHRHSGTIWVESELGKGTTFSFVLNSPTSREALLSPPVMGAMNGI